MKELFLIPRPQKMEKTDGFLGYLGACFDVDDERILQYLQVFEQGKTLVVFQKIPNLHPEGYTLCVDTQSIRIQYGTLEGAFRAVSTLKQLVAQVEDGQMPCLQIQDYPSIPRRGHLMDLSRGVITKLEVLKKFADILADLKYNEWHLYLNRFGFQFKNFERYWKDKNALTAEEIRELDQYCQERFIKLVPNINTFGHMESFTTKEEFKHLAITDRKGNPSYTLNPLLDESLEFLDSIFDGFFDNFASDVVHIGMDETIHLGLSETKEACEKQGVGRVYTDFLNKVLDLIDKKYHKRPMFWADIVFKHPEELKNIPEYSVVMDWGYEAEYNYEGHCALLEKMGLRYYVCPGTSMWASFTGRSNNAVFNMLSAAISARDHHAEGYLLTDWADTGYPQFYSTAYFPWVFGGAVAWNPGEDAENFRTKLILDCEQYLDRYIYHVSGDVSLAHIAFQMGNYYLLEDRLLFNMTYCYYYLVVSKEISKRDIAGFRRVIAYMEELLEELKTVQGGDAHKEYIAENARMVILLCKMHCGDIVTEEEFAAMKERFIMLKDREDKPYLQGDGVFIRTLNKGYARYKEKL